MAVLASGVSTVSTAANTVRPRGWTFFQTSSTEYFTSADVNGSPSCQVAPLRRLNFSTVPSALNSQLSARPGRSVMSWP